MSSAHLPKLTKTLMQSYSKAALRNADELLVEASLLSDHDHRARAYFLAEDFAAAEPLCRMRDFVREPERR